MVYFSGTERSHIGGDIYRVKLDGTGLTRLSQTRRHAQRHLQPGFAHYLDTWSDLHTPPQVRLHAADGSERARWSHESTIPALAEYRLVEARVPAGEDARRLRDGGDALSSRPALRAARKYPVYAVHLRRAARPAGRATAGAAPSNMFLPAARRARHRRVDLRQPLGAAARAAVGVDRPTSSSARSELADIEDGLAWLQAAALGRPARIGIDGWSYGGFMTTYALTHCKSFAMGIGGAPVTDWRSTTPSTPSGYADAAEQPRGLRQDLGR